MSNYELFFESIYFIYEDSMQSANIFKNQWFGIENDSFLVYISIFPPILSLPKHYYFSAWLKHEFRAQVFEDIL